jgi:putative ABC transport system permease protein
MRLGRAVRLSRKALFAHRLRAGLVLLSVGVGVAAVLAAAAIGAGARREVLRRIERLGTNLLVVRPAQVERSAARRQVRGLARSLTLDDYRAIAALPAVRRAAPALEGGARVEARGVATTATLLGTTPAFPAVRNFELAAGRFLDEDDERAARRVAVVGARVAEALFPGEDPVGRDVRLRRAPFEVVGVLRPKGASAAGGDEDSLVWVPLGTARRRVFNSSWLDVVFVSAVDRDRMAALEAEIAALLRQRHSTAAPGGAGRSDDFTVQNTSRLLAIERQMGDSLSLVASGLGALALLVGSTGILALMLVSVRERTGEIGLRLAVGARPRDILAQFLIEATLLALAGWAAGLALGAAAALVVTVATSWTLGLPAGALRASLAMAVTVGLASGALPALRASRLRPIAALRAE